ncbi:CHASE2 domain-containing protein [Imbroritus primus]|uniref:CHASE2 domain-containing protein n=1 Tax=Imbroritus primus TaxID=3058603 RepID=A0ACD3SSC2_9BURK|nr:CHASE2 domain-containing protein [Burkholderiaceae bacterium PBA]
MKSADSTASFTRRTIVEWLIFAPIIVILTAYAASFSGLGRPDQALYDHSIARLHRTPSPEIVIVAIDDASIQALGRWPWRRALHASLLTHICATPDMQPRALGLALILSEPDERYPHDDVALANAMRRCPHVVLPATIESIGSNRAEVRRPLSIFAARHGHINLEIDSDGIARSVFLVEGDRRNPLDHFAVEMVADDPRFPSALPNVRRQRARPASAMFGPNWTRDKWMYIPFVGPPGSFETVSYVDVLRGSVPESMFAGKYVLIGATATGLNDSFPTAVSGSGQGMSGVEIIATVMQSLMDGSEIAPLSRQWSMLLSVVAVLVTLGAVLLLPPRWALLATGVILVSVLLLCLVLLDRAHVWFAPMAALIGIALVYPIWSWRRQEAALRYLADEFSRLDQEPVLFHEAISTHRMSDTLDQRVMDMHRVTSRVRNLRQFLADGIDSVPDATVVCNLGGRVTLANRQAVALIGHLDVPGVGRDGLEDGGAALRDIVAELFPDSDAGQRYVEQLIAGETAPLSERSVDGIELTDRSGRAMLMRGGPLRTSMGTTAGYIVIWVDINSIRQAERKREEMMRFLSHDIRSPQASILALLELQKDRNTAVSENELAQRVSNYARRTLGLADEFIQLAKAESSVIRQEPLDLVEIVMDASDEMWVLANAHGVTLLTDLQVSEASVVGDRSLLVRAVINLTGNAIKFSPAKGTVTLRLRAEDHVYVIEVIDQGRGISPEDQLRLFQPFQRIQVPGQVQPEGIGLGLVFVRTVVQRHNGDVGVHSAHGAGATFFIRLPAQLTEMAA